MSYHKRLNRHDAWIEHRKRNAVVLAEIGLPDEVLMSEEALAEFLTAGSCARASMTIDTIPEEAFWKLFRFATSWFDSAAGGFAAMEARRVRGNGGRT